MRGMSLHEVIEGLVQKYGSINAAAIECRMPGQHLWMLYTGKRKQPTVATLRKIAAGMDVALDELIRRLEDGRGDGSATE
ncbi:hypothetical protein LCGC14_2497640 [marine sediment metagenome]|uniref:HTH cro/C1-type domain-containing protein n=1 Tax=marine sediment metagenome TaxID=412755 RepID=A0A0F9B3P1_9ZZZZ